MPEKSSIFMCCFLRKAHSTEQTPFIMMFPSGTHFSIESTEAMRIKSPAQGHDILMHLGFGPSSAVSGNRHLTHMTNRQVICEKRFVK